MAGTSSQRLRKRSQPTRPQRGSLRGPNAWLVSMVAAILGLGRHLLWSAQHPSSSFFWHRPLPLSTGWACDSRGATVIGPGMGTGSKPSQLESFPGLALVENPFPSGCAAQSTSSPHTTTKHVGGEVEIQKGSRKNQRVSASFTSCHLRASSLPAFPGLVTFLSV